MLNIRFGRMMAAAGLLYAIAATIDGTIGYTQHRSLRLVPSTLQLSQEQAVVHQVVVRGRARPGLPNSALYSVIVDF